MPTLILEGGRLRRAQLGENFYDNQFYMSYITSSYRQSDLPHGKQPLDDDTSDSDHEENTPASNPSQRTITRKELNALDRKIPWREILKLPAEQIDACVASAAKEASSWLEWNSVEPVLREQAKEILSDPRLRRRILKSRAVYRDKVRGQGPLRPKCRVVCLGHDDPDLKRLSREAPTPTRMTEHVFFALIVAGCNHELETKGKPWTSWIGDASTAFLQVARASGNLSSMRSLPTSMAWPTHLLSGARTCRNAS